MKSCKNCIRAYSGLDKKTERGKEPEIICSALKAMVNFKADFDQEYEFVKMVQPETIADFCIMYQTMSEAQNEYTLAQKKQRSSS